MSMFQMWPMQLCVVWAGPKSFSIPIVDWAFNHPTEQKFQITSFFGATQLQFPNCLDCIWPV